MVKACFVGSLVVLLVAGAASAETDIGFKGVGGRIGYIFPPAEGFNGTVGFDASVDLGRLTPNIMLEPGLRYFSSGADGSVDGSLKNFQIYANGKYLFQLPESKWEPYLGAGLSIYFSSVDVGGVSDSQNDIGLNLLGGSYFKVSPKVKLAGELAYAVVSDIAHFSLFFGAMFALGGGGATASP